MRRRVSRSRTANRHWAVLIKAADIWLSILLPVYNVEQYLAQCVQSLLSQDAHIAGVEIVMVDDSSTDDSRAIAQSLQRQYPQVIKLFCHAENQGVSVTRNRLLEEASGAHIWFVDPDDYVLDGALAELRVIIETYDPDLVLCDYRKSNFAKTKSFYGPTRQLSSDIAQLVTGVFKSRKMYCWLRVSRRSLWQNGPHFPVGKIFEDIATTPWLLLKARNYYYAPSAWIFYRKRAGSIMDSVKRKREVFDMDKHRDLAVAMAGFKEDMHRQMGADQAPARYYVADFSAKEFVKTGFRFLQAGELKRGAALDLHAFLELFQACSPIMFDRLATEYLKRFKIIRYAMLKYILYRAKPSPGTVSGDQGPAS